LKNKADDYYRACCFQRHVKRGYAIGWRWLLKLTPVFILLEGSFNQLAYGSQTTQLMRSFLEFENAASTQSSPLGAWS
jgi:hypothetical protein